MLISKEKFCEYIQLYKDTIKYLDQLYDLKIEIMDDNLIWKQLDSLSELLHTAVYDYMSQEEMDKVNKTVTGSDLSYWMYELECGERLKSNPMMWTRYDRPIEADTPEKMYDYLLAEQAVYMNYN